MDSSQITEKRKSNSLTFHKFLQLFTGSMSISSQLLPIIYISTKDTSIETWYYTDAGLVIRQLERHYYSHQNIVDRFASLASESELHISSLSHMHE